MTDVFFSAKNLAFYPADDRGYYEEAGAWPDDAKPLTAKMAATYWKASTPQGKQLGATSAGSPTWLDYSEPLPATVEEATAKRMAAYRSESDPLKNEAEYDAMLIGAEPDYGPWMEKVKEIKLRFPMPAVS